DIADKDDLPGTTAKRLGSVVSPRPAPIIQRFRGTTCQKTDPSTEIAMRSVRMYCTSVSLAIVSALPAIAQQTSAASAQARSNVIAASFSKSISMSKEKLGIRKKKYINVQSYPADRLNPTDYSGSYAFPYMDVGFQV